MRGWIVLAICAMFGSAAGFAAECPSCHQDYATYAHTAHALTSQAAGKDSILGPFTGDRSTLKVRDAVPSLTFRMEQRQDGYYQTAIAGIPGHEQSHSARIDVVTGSGTRGQSYLYWLGDQLFELPLSYWTDGAQWINSPGFRDGTANFSRPVYPRCLECHATAITALSPDPFSNHYEKASLVTGIACATCHGPGTKHPAILNPAKFSRDRQVDLCALCHSGGQREELQPAFSYLPGEVLDQYLKANPADAAEQPEVHGNQVGLLKRSRCYVASPAMSCSTCHDVHQPEKEAASYSSKCLGCHEAKSCPKRRPNCIDCHMPRLQTNAIVSRTAGKETRASMRTHWIRVY
jgi:hypothetical protein